MRQKFALVKESRKLSGRQNLTWIQDVDRAKLIQTCEQKKNFRFRSLDWMLSHPARHAAYEWLVPDFSASGVCGLSFSVLDAARRYHGTLATMMRWVPRR